MKQMSILACLAVVWLLAGAANGQESPQFLPHATVSPASADDADESVSESSVDLEQIRRLIRRIMPTANVQPILLCKKTALLDADDQPVPLNKNVILLTGTVAKAEDAPVILARLVEATGQGFINGMRVDGEVIVGMDVIIAEVDGLKGSEDSISKILLSAWGFQDKIPAIAPAKFQRILDSLSLLGNLGLARFLCEPSLLALSGQEACFLAGSKVEIPQPPDLPNSPRFLQYGIQLRLSPIMLKTGKIALNAEVTENARELTEGTTIHGTESKHMQVELQDGETMMLIGPSPRKTNERRAAPAKTKATQRIIFITPHIVRPDQNVTLGQIGIPSSPRKDIELTSATAEPRNHAVRQEVKHAQPAGKRVRVAGSKLLNGIRVANAKQVQMDVIIAEIDCPKGSANGVSKTLLSAWGLKDPVITPERFRRVLASLNSLRELGVARFLSEPRLTAISGQEASVLSGGKMAVPQPKGLPKAPRFLEYGIRLRFLPIVLKTGKIAMNVEISEKVIKPHRGTTINGSEVPGFSTETKYAQVELEDGQTMMFIGPIGPPPCEADNCPAPAKMKTTQRIIFITPHIVQPIPCNTLPPSSPQMDAEKNPIKNVEFRTDSVRQEGANSNPTAKRVRVAGSWGKAVANRVRREAKGNKLILEGNVQLELPGTGRATLLRAERICIDLETGQLDAN